jgi:hypothetical protein
MTIQNANPKKNWAEKSLARGGGPAVYGNDFTKNTPELATVVQWARVRRRPAVMPHGLR